MTPYYQDESVTIYHGDCREVLGSDASQSDLAIFDPPYNVGKGYASHDDKMTLLGYEELIVATLGLLDARTLTWFSGAVNIASALPRVPATGWDFQRLLAWHKKEYAGDVFYSGPAMCWEPIIWATHGKPFHNKVFGPWGRDLLVVPSTHGDPLRLVHPCPKPLAVAKWLISLFTPDVGSVLDPMCGTGFALRAAKDLGRTAIGIEVEERYCEVAANRLAQEVLAL